ncbi:MAG: toluene monooxygenase [Gammaproteobacteria bacterium]|nr:toluene monooxygenase [Gammaproteobacteria bacterium]
MAAFPLHCNFQGDFVLQLILVDSEDTMDEAAQKCAYHTVGRRVAPRPDKILRVRKHGGDSFFPRELKVADTGLRPTETIDVIFADS